jgi:transcription elongation GreA/GreB family factor
VAGDSAVPKDMVFLGATVKLRDTATGKTQKYKLVGNMTDDDGDYIEVTSSSPLGVALMKARVGETVRADLPKGEKRFEIVAICD